MSRHSHASQPIAVDSEHPLVPSRDVVPLYRANPEAFAAQMEVFERMRETERAFKGERS